MLIISDVHGSVSALEQALSWYETYACNHIVLLGDLLNHGPRNPIPAGYEPAAVAETLNRYADRVIAIRGNCDSEVDQMLCSFPMMAEYNWLLMGGRRLLLTHGHLLNPDNPPPLSPGEGLLFGHTHIPVAEWRNQTLVFNPGSITIPKDGYSRSFGYFNGERFSVRELESGQEMMAVDWNREEPE